MGLLNSQHWASPVLGRTRIVVWRNIQVLATRAGLSGRCPGQRMLTESQGCMSECQRSSCTGWTTASRAPCPLPYTSALLPCLPRHRIPALQVYQPISQSPLTLAHRQCAGFFPASRPCLKGTSADARTHLESYRLVLCPSAGKHAGIHASHGLSASCKEQQLQKQLFSAVGAWQWHYTLMLSVYVQYRGAE